MIPVVLSRIIAKYIIPKLVACCDGYYYEFNGTNWIKKSTNDHKAIFITSKHFHFFREFTNPSDFDGYLPYIKTMSKKQMLYQSFSCFLKINVKIYGYQLMPKSFGSERCSYCEADDVFYKFGGNQMPSKYVSYYENDEWLQTTPMIEPHLNPHVGYIKNKFIVIGKSVCEMFDIKTKEWSLIAPVTICSKLVQFRTYENELFVLTEKIVYIYDLLADQWTTKTHLLRNALFGFL